MENPLGLPGLSLGTGQNNKIAGRLLKLINILHLFFSMPFFKQGMELCLNRSQDWFSSVHSCHKASRIIDQI